MLELNAVLPRIAIRVGDMKLVIGKSDGDWPEPPENAEGADDGVECEEENTNFAGYGIEGNKVNNAVVVL